MYSFLGHIFQFLSFFFSTSYSVHRISLPLFSMKNNGIFRVIISEDYYQSKRLPFRLHGGYGSNIEYREYIKIARSELQLPFIAERQIG